MVHRISARERLLDAADELLARQGWAGTPVDTVLAKAGVAPATLYAHFGSKDRLLAATLERRLDRWDVAWSDAVAAAVDDRGRLLAVFDALAAFDLAYTPARWCAFLGAATDGSVSEETVADAVRRDSALMRDRLVELAGPALGGGAAGADVALGRAEALADHLVLVVTGCLGMRLREPTADRVAQARATGALVVDAALAS